MRIHNMFLRVLYEDKRLREQRAASLEATRKLNEGTRYATTTIPPTLSAPVCSNGQRVTLDHLDVHNLPQDHQLDVYNFLRTTYWQPATEGCNGTSWVELLARFSHLGGQAAPTVDTNPLAKLPSLGTRLRSFTLAFKQGCQHPRCT